MSTHFDALETQEHSARERELFARLPQFLARAVTAAPGWASRLAGIDPALVTSRAALAKVPVLRKPELMEAQAANPPFGGLADVSQLDGARYFMSPGPVWEPQAPGADSWNSARAFHAAGIGAGRHRPQRARLSHDAWRLHPRRGRARRRCKGVSSRHRQYGAAGRGGALAEADRLCRNAGFSQGHAGQGRRNGTRSLVHPQGAGLGRRAFPVLREEYRSRGVSVMQCYATADLGVIAYETQKDGTPLPGMVVSENIILEIVRPGTDDPVQPGEVGRDRRHQLQRRLSR